MPRLVGLEYGEVLDALEVSGLDDEETDRAGPDHHGGLDRAVAQCQPHVVNGLRQRLGGGGEPKVHTGGSATRLRVGTRTNSAKPPGRWIPRLTWSGQRLGYAQLISNRVVDAIGDVAGGVRVHDGTRETNDETKGSS